MALIRWIISVVDLFSYDRTWIAGLAFLWSILEVNTGLICGCLMVSMPLFHKDKKRHSDDIQMKAPQPVSRQRLNETKSDLEEGEDFSRSIIGERREVGPDLRQPEEWQFDFE